MFADVVVLGANVITVDQKNPRVQAFAVKQGKIVAVGNTSEIKKSVGRQTQVIDARGKTVTPGFYDAHLHPAPVYPYESAHFKVDLSPQRVQTIDDVITALKEKARITPKWVWVRGSQYQDTKLGRHLTRWDLDKVSTEHPILIDHSSLHVSVVNSVALANASITKNIKEPADGAFDRDDHGEPTGVCREGATAAVFEAGPAIPPATRKEQLKGIGRCFKNFLSKGITSIGDAWVNPAQIELYLDALEAGLPLRIYMMVRDHYLPEMKKLKFRSGFGNDRLRIGPIKVFRLMSSVG